MAMLDFSQNVQKMRSNFRDLPSEQIVYSFCYFMEEELRSRREKGLDEILLKSYYKNLFTGDGRIVPVGALGYSHRLAPLVRQIQIFPGSARILDAGSGYGTESLLVSLLGGEVSSVELVSERTELARSRINFYQSLSPFALNLKFYNANIFRFLLKSEPFDIIWVMEAISHIYPPEDFLVLAYEKLRKGGKLIISDPNRLNPLVWLTEVKIRGSISKKTHSRFKDPETGQAVAYGQENRFSVLGIKKKLREAGFEIEEVNLAGFMGSTVLPKSFLRRKGAFSFLSFYQKIMKNFPGLRYLGSLYTIVASKET